MKWTITIPDWHPTPLNKLMNVHWAKRSRMKKDNYQFIGVYAHQNDVPKAIGKRSVKITIVRPAQRGRPPDADAYQKVTYDALVACERLVDDSPKWCVQLPLEFEVGDKATRIELEDL